MLTDDTFGGDLDGSDPVTDQSGVPPVPLGSTFGFFLSAFLIPALMRGERG